MDERVLDQGGERLRLRALESHGHQPGRPDADEPSPGGLEGRCPLGDLRGDQVVEVERLVGRDARAAADADDLVHDAGEPLDLPERRRGLRPDDVEVVGPEDLLEAQRQGGERRPELVAGLGGDPALALEEGR